MAVLIGTDEAGYGPNLGPLVVSATMWQVPGTASCVDLYQRLSDTVCAGVAESARRGCLALADSKVLYTAGCGLGHLERGVLAALSVIGSCPGTWRELWTLLEPDAGPSRDGLPWHRDYDAQLPVANECGALQLAADHLRAGLRRAGVSLCCLQAAVVQPQRLNRLIEQLGTKGAALSLITLELVSRVLCRAQDATVWVVCDKHGGRNRYGPLLQQHFPEYLIEVHHESHQQSVYRTGPRERRVEFRFCVHGEQFLPSALASMVAKYVRELSMAAFNEFWQRHQPDLRPTAGYPTDARRFKRDIADLQRRLAIDDQVLWRVR